MHPYKEFKDIANKIVGDWYHTKEDEIVKFSLVSKFGEYVPFWMVINGKTTEGIYCIGIEPPENLEDTSKWYFDTGYPDTLGKRPTYYIISISSDEMVLKMPNGEPFTYTRKIDQAFVDGVLKGLH